jgi:hypothetical protein
MAETKRFHRKLDEFINNSLKTSAVLHPRQDSLHRSAFCHVPATSWILAAPATR